MKAISTKQMSNITHATSSFAFCMAVIGSFGFLLLFTASLNYGGFCISQRRFLSDSEKIHIAVTYTNSNSVVPLKVGRDLRYYKSVRYKDADDLIRQNPNCCRITINERFGDTPTAPSFLSRLFGLYGADVTIDYTAHYIDERGNEQSAHKQWLVVLNNCGKRTKY